MARGQPFFTCIQYITIKDFKSIEYGLGMYTI
jgi:hypothetical protein